LGLIEEAAEMGVASAFGHGLKLRPPAPSAKRARSGPSLRDSGFWRDAGTQASIGTVRPAAGGRRHDAKE
jgi:hypothetical protein